jgi:hypothetical protein
VSGVMGSREWTGVVLKAGFETGSRGIVGGVGGRALPGWIGDVRGGSSWWREEARVGSNGCDMAMGLQAC